VRSRSADQIRALFEVSRDLLAIADGDGLVVAANPAWERVLGRSPASLVGTNLLDLVHPEDLPRTIEVARRLRAQRAEHPAIENRYRHADGHWVWLRWSSITRRDDGFVYVAAHDVTEERRGAEELRRALQRLEEAQRAARLGSWEYDFRTGERFYTRELYLLQGMDPDRDAPWSVEEVLAEACPEDRPGILELQRRVFAEPGRHRVEFRLQRAPQRILEATVALVRDDDGRPILLHGTTQDVTELRENERRLAEAERVAGIGSFEWRPPDGEMEWSAGTYRVFGRDPAAGPLGTGEFWAAMLPEEAEHVQAVLERALADDAPWEVEYSIATPGGERRTVFSRGEVYRVGDRKHVRGTIQDVTEQRRASAQQQAIARLGQLALAGTDLKELFDEVCRVVTELLGTDIANVLAVQDDGSLVFASSVGFPREGTAIAAGDDSIVRHALAADAPQVVSDWAVETRFPYSDRLRESGVRCTAVVPVRGRDGPYGVLTTHARQPGVTDPVRNFAFLEALASFLATAIERLRHEGEIAALAALRGRLVAENLDAEERVRQRISEQLHDGALQDLLAARQDLVEAEGARNPGTRDEMLGLARQGVERTVRLLREAVQALHPVVLQHGGLEAAMRAAADQAARQGAFRAEVAVDPAAAGLRDELVLSLARELLNNAAKHAEADVVRVTVARQNGSVLLEVADDGRGLDPEAVAAAPMKGHIGLASMAQRVEAVGGSLDLRAAPSEQGTTVLARLPID